jgi:hypothetical protein
VEAFREVVHRHLALRDRAHLNAAYEALETLARTATEVHKEDVDRARTLSADQAVVHVTRLPARVEHATPRMCADLEL